MFTKKGHKLNSNIMLMFWFTWPPLPRNSWASVLLPAGGRWVWGTLSYKYFWISFKAKFLNRWAAIGAFCFLNDDIWALGFSDGHWGQSKEPTICSSRLTRTVICCRKRRCSATSYCNRCMGNALNATGQWREPVQATFVQATMPWTQTSSHLQLQGVELTLIDENILGLGWERIKAHIDIWS